MEEMKHLLPFELSIQDRRQTGRIVVALYQVFRFTRLPEAYFANQLQKLPDHPEELLEQFHRLFPITERGDLRDILEYCSQLQQYYTFDKLPETYFNALPKNLQLLAMPQELKEQLRNLFPCKSTDAEAFKTFIDLLREHYSFTRVPKTFFVEKQ
ncbi:10862_t:CDS:1, partial [Gigaspora rosea]